ncbi:MAG: Uma2 family endonuclease [Oscillospiraceae bacterium]|nr:Uma2 family endonuclease [Oscillospiraceae bacterium]
MNASPLKSFKYQVIGGKIINMAPSSPNHGIISSGLNYIFRDYFTRKNCKECRVYNESNYIRLDIIQKEKNIELPEECDKDKYTPDVMVICDKTIDTIKGVTGAPDLVVEILSRSTEKYDITIKKQVYELIGVKEYWIVDYRNKSIEVYIQKNKKYGIPEIYYHYTEDEISRIEEEREDTGENMEIFTKFSPSIFPDLIIQTDDIFDGLLE